MPESYWQPFLGELSLRPCDIGDLTPQKLDACWDHWQTMKGVS